MKRQASVIGGRVSVSYLLFCYWDEKTLDDFRTFTAGGPLGPLSRLNSTLLPFSKASKSISSKAELWKNTSLPSSTLMNPNPLSRISFFIFPFPVLPPLDKKFHQA